jgi:hypothetical protein
MPHQGDDVDGLTRPYRLTDGVELRIGGERWTDDPGFLAGAGLPGHDAGRLPGPLPGTQEWAFPPPLPTYEPGGGRSTRAPRRSPGGRTRLLLEAIAVLQGACQRGHGARGKMGKESIWPRMETLRQGGPVFATRRASGACAGRPLPKPSRIGQLHLTLPGIAMTIRRKAEVGRGPLRGAGLSSAPHRPSRGGRNRFPAGVTRAAADRE